MSSFPTAIRGDEGQQYQTYNEEKGISLGSELVLPDGRKFRFVKAGATATVAGSLYQAEVPGANFDELAVAAAAVGASTVTVTNGATAITANMFKGGFLNVEDDAGEGRAYRIKSHPAAAGSATCVITLEAEIQEALTTSSTVGLTKHPCSAVIIHPSPPTAKLVGVAVSDIPAANWGWVQFYGPCSVLTDGTVVIAASVMASNGTDGSVEAWGLTEAAPPTEISSGKIGEVMEVAATTEYSLIFLNL